MTMLLAVTGARAGVRYPLGQGKVVFGRSSSADVQLHEPEIGRQHFMVEWNGKGHQVTHLGSTNGTWVNGVRLLPKEARVLVPGDVIGVGNVALVYQPELEYCRGEGTDLIVDQRPVELGGRHAVGGEADPRIAAFMLDLVARATEGKGEGEDPLARALWAIADRFSADRAFVVRAEGEGQPLKVLKSFGAGPIVVSRTVIKTVIEERQAVLFGDAAGDLSLRGGVSLAAGQIRSLLAAPLIFDERTFGVLHVDRKDRHAYRAQDLEAFAAASRLFSLVVLATAGVSKLRQKARAKKATRPPLIAVSPAFVRVVAEVDRAAKARSTVLLEGETGTGKEVLARRIHEESDRSDGPFVAINCGALPEGLAESELFGHEAGAFTGATSSKVGLFEAADGGTLFLDEIGETDRTTQVKLLRALQEQVFFRLGSATPREVDVRIISATSKSLTERVAHGHFRDDLYFRLAVIQVRVPPLRERPEDIGPLAAAFAKTFAEEAGMLPKTLSSDVLELLSKRRFAGNVRELANTIERLVILGEGQTIGIGDLPADLLAGTDEVDRAAQQGQTLAEVLAQVERAMILRAMARSGGVKVAAAEALAISRVTLDAKLKAYGLLGSEKKFRSGEIPE